MDESDAMAAFSQVPTNPTQNDEDDAMFGEAEGASTSFEAEQSLHSTPKEDELSDDHENVQEDEPSDDHESIQEDVQMSDHVDESPVDREDQPVSPAVSIEAHTPEPISRKASEEKQVQSASRRLTVRGGPVVPGLDIPKASRVDRPSLSRDVSPAVSQASAGSSVRSDVSPAASQASAESFVRSKVSPVVSQASAESVVRLNVSPAVSQASAESFVRSNVSPVVSQASAESLVRSAAATHPFSDLTPEQAAEKSGENSMAVKNEPDTVMHAVEENMAADEANTNEVGSPTDAKSALVESQSEQAPASAPKSLSTGRMVKEMMARRKAARLAGKNVSRSNDAMDLDSEDEDYSWMELEEDDDEDEASAKLQEQISTLYIRKRNGKITELEQMTLNRLEARHRQTEQRQRVGQRDQREVSEEADSLFISETNGNSNRRKKWNRSSPARDNEQFDGDESSDEEQSKAEQVKRERKIALDLQKESLPKQASQSSLKQASQSSSGKKTRRKPAKTAREARARKAQDDLEKERVRERKKAQKQKARATKGKDKKVASARKGKKPATGKKSKKGKDKQKKKIMVNMPGGFDQTGAEILNNLVYTDAIAERAQQGDLGEAPVYTATTKDAQFKQILDSIPLDLDFKKSKADRTTLRNAAKNFGRGMIKADRGNWLLKGMKTALYNHQLLAADWMIDRECTSNAPYGGINADAMGLGKTIELIATIIGNPPSAEDDRNGVKATLIVVPSSVVQQWQDEIRKHCDAKTLRRVIKFKSSQELDQITLEDTDVVITTYYEVMNSYPYPSQELARRLGIEGMTKWLTDHADKIGLLHQVEWYRVVLDEAHAIKNYLSKTSIACTKLKSKYRWALSGTPITNRLEELFPYLRFLRAPFSDDFYQFRQHFCDTEADDSNSRLMVLLGMILIRRTFKDKLLGRPIVELPEAHSKLERVSYTNAETLLYRLVEDKFRDNLNHHFKHGTAQKHYGVFFVQLLRLRQLTNHPFLLEQTIKDLFTADDMNYLKKQLSTMSNNPAPLFEQIKVWLEQDEDGERVPFGRNDFGTYYKMDKYLELPEQELISRVLCNICGDVPVDARAADCEHVFCKECIENAIHQQTAEGRDHNECPKCQRIMTNTKPYTDLQTVDGEDADEAPESQASSSRPSSQSASKSKAKPKGKQTKKTRAEAAAEKAAARRLSTPGSDNLGYEEETKSSWLALADRTADVDLLPSAKMIALKKELLMTFKEAPEDKVLIFTQFRLSARIMARICKQEGWGFVYFTGGMSKKQRHEAVKVFHEKPEVKIMIAGLKCGGVALNLTCANRVISLDLWWNHSIEQQAFGRVFRIGQKKETYFTRLVVANTVDQRMLQMQAEKVQAIDRAMRDDGSTIQPLTMSELAGLFGYVREDEEGNIRIEADYNDSDPSRDTSFDAMDEDEDHGEGPSGVGDSYGVYGWEGEDGDGEEMEVGEDMEVDGEVDGEGGGLGELLYDEEEKERMNLDEEGGYDEEVRKM